MKLIRQSREHEQSNENPMSVALTSRPWLAQIVYVRMEKQSILIEILLWTTWYVFRLIRSVNVYKSMVYEF